MNIQVSDILHLKKKHPCGSDQSDQWEVLRIGTDFKLRCLGCGHEIMIPRSKIQKNIINITKTSETNPQG